MKTIAALLLAVLTASLVHGELQTKISGDFLSIKLTEKSRDILQWKLLRLDDISAIECAPAQKSGNGIQYEITVILSPKGDAPNEKLVFKGLTRADAEQVIQQTITLIGKD